MPETVQSQQKSKIRYKAVQDKHTRPPMRFRASRMVTLAPFWMRISAQRKPEIPEPTTPMWGLDPIAQKRQMDLIGWWSGKWRMQLLMMALNMNNCKRRDGKYPTWLDVFWFKAGGKACARVDWLSVDLWKTLRRDWFAWSCLKIRKFFKGGRG